MKEVRASSERSDGVIGNPGRAATGGGAGGKGGRLGDKAARVASGWQGRAGGKERGDRVTRWRGW